jgi:hypothetical protein
MSKIIVRVDEGVTDEDATVAVAEVVRKGKISAEGKSYCYGSLFGGLGLVVSTRGTRPNGTTTFYVYPYADPSREAGRC